MCVLISSCLPIHLILLMRFLWREKRKNSSMQFLYRILFVHCSHSYSLSKHELLRTERTLANIERTRKTKSYTEECRAECWRWSSLNKCLEVERSTWYKLCVQCTCFKWFRNISDFLFLITSKWKRLKLYWR